MSEFKGTGGYWRIREDEKTVVENQDGIVITETDYPTAPKEEIQANALLISKSPEMLDEINETIKDLLCLQVSINEAMKIDNRWEGMYELLQKQIDRKKELIKSATEI